MNIIKERKPKYGIPIEESKNRTPRQVQSNEPKENRTSVKDEPVARKSSPRKRKKAEGRKRKSTTESTGTEHTAIVGEESDAVQTEESEI